MDVDYLRNASGHVSGIVSAIDGNAPLAIYEVSPTGWHLAFAPAIEYNLTANVGLITGVRVIELGRNASGSITPVAAINLVL